MEGAPADTARPRQVKNTSPARPGFIVGAVTGLVFFVVGFAGGHGPRIERITGNPAWVYALEVLAFVGFAVGMVFVLRGRAWEPRSMFGFAGGWAAGVALFVGLAVFFDARAGLRRFGLLADGGEDVLAGTQAPKTRESANTLAVVNAFLSFVGAFAVGFIAVALASAIVRSAVSGVLRLLRAIGVMKPDARADF